MASLGELFVTVGANVAGFKAAMTDVKNDAGGASDAINKQLLGAVTALTGAAVAAGLAIDDAFDKIQVGTGASGPLLASLQTSFSNVFAATPSSSDDVSAVIADLHTKLGLVGPALENAATQMLNLSRITGTEAKPVIEEATRLFGDWSVTTNDQGKALDYIFKVSQETGTEIGTLMTQMVQFGAPLRGLGIDFETAAGLVGKFQQEGVNAELVLGSLRIALGRMAAEGITDAKAGLDSIIESITNAKTPTEATKLAIEAFGAKAGPDMALAIREGRFELDGLIEKLAESSTTINAAATATDGFKESLTLAKNQATLLLEPIGTVLLDALNALLGMINPVATALKSVREEVSGWVAPFQVAVGLLGPVGLALGALSGNTKDAKDKAVEYHPELKKVVDEAKKVKDEHDKAKPKITGVKTAMEAAKKKADALATAYSELGLKDTKKEADDLRSAIDTLKSSGDWNKLSVEDQKTALDKLDAATLAASGKSYDFSQKLLGLSTSLKTLYTDTSNEEFALDTLLDAVSALDTAIQDLPMPGMIQDMIDVTTKTAEAAGKAVTFKDNLATLGITGQADLEAIKTKAAEARDAILGSDLATDWEKKTAIYKALKAQVDYAKQVGIDVPADQAAALQKMSDELDKPDTGLPNIKGKFEKLSNEVSTIITNFAQSISDSLWDGDTSWGEKGLALLTDLGKAVTSSFITPAVEAITGFVTSTINGLLKGAFDNVGEWLGTLGSKMAGIFGGGVDVASGASGAAGSAGSAGGGAGAAAGGAMATIGAIGSIGTMISSIIGNFQSAKMETTLNAIEESTRYTKIYLGDLLPKLVNDLATGIPLIHLYMIGDMQSVLTRQLTELETIKTNTSGGGGVAASVQAAVDDLAAEVPEVAQSWGERAGKPLTDAAEVIRVVLHDWSARVKDSAASARGLMDIAASAWSEKVGKPLVDAAEVINVKTGEWSERLGASASRLFQAVDLIPSKFDAVARDWSDRVKGSAERLTQAVSLISSEIDTAVREGARNTSRTESATEATSVSTTAYTQDGGYSDLIGAMLRVGDTLLNAMVSMRLALQSVLTSVHARLLEMRVFGLGVYAQPGFSGGVWDPSVMRSWATRVTDTMISGIEWGSIGGGVTIQIQGNVIGTDDAAQTFADIIAAKLTLQGAG